MSRVVCIDSTIFVWGIKRNATKGQEHKIPQAVRFIEWLDEEQSKILIPTPVITELLSYYANEIERLAVLRLMTTSNIILKSFDVVCALKCAELLQKTYSEPEIETYKTEQKAPKAKIKYDAMIAATAIVNDCDCIYAEDGDIERYAHGQIAVYKMPIISSQQDLFSDLGGLPF